MRRASGNPVLIGEDIPAYGLEAIDLKETTHNEAWLQALIHQHPELIPLREIEPGFGDAIPICREFNTKHGPIDNILVTPEGNIIVVEVKLWRNPESRRKVVAQALDYASCLFEMSYAEFEAAILATTSWNGQKPKSLYDLVINHSDALEEAAFIDAVSTNLARGRILILILGDGIRSETERLASLLESHAGAHFTFALVEIGLFKITGTEQILAVPRTLAQTQMIHRGIVEIDDRRTLVKLAGPKASSAKPGATPTNGPARKLPESITAEQFYDDMARVRDDLPEKLKNLIAQLETIGVHAEFRNSLNFKWEAPNGKVINFGMIDRQGRLWTDFTRLGSPELDRAYKEQLAAAIGAEAELSPKGFWQVRANGKGPSITEFADQLDLWPGIAQLFINRLAENLAPE